MIDEPEMPPLGLRYGSNPGGHGGRGPGRGGGRGRGGPGFSFWHDDPLGYPTDEEDENRIRRSARERIRRSGLSYHDVVRFLNRVMVVVRRWYFRNFTLVMMRNEQTFFG